MPQPARRDQGSARYPPVPQGCRGHRDALIQATDGSPMPETIEAAMEVEPRERGGTTALILSLRKRPTSPTKSALHMRIQNPAARLHSRTTFHGADKGRGPLGVTTVKTATRGIMIEVDPMPLHPAAATRSTVIFVASKHCRSAVAPHATKTAMRCAGSAADATNLQNTRTVRRAPRQLLVPRPVRMPSVATPPRPLRK
jgi:hypothetical protein